LWPDRALDGVGVELDAAVAQEALESGAPGCGIANRLGEFGFAGQARQLLLPQIEQRFDDGGRLFLACFHPRCRILAADVGLDRPKPGHCRDGLCRQLRALVDVKLVESPPDVGKAGCQRHALIGARGPREPIIGGIAVDLQDAGKACQMAFDAFAGAAVLEAIGDHRWTVAAKWPIVARIGPQPGLLRLAGSGSERRQGRLVGEDPLALLDLLQHIVGQGLQFEADLAHPLCHQRSVEIDTVTRIDRLLPVQRQPVGIFGHRDLGEKRFGRKPTLDQVRRRRRLNYTVAIAIDVFRARHDQAELRRRHVKALRHVLADQNLLQPLATRRHLGLDDDLHPLQMRAELLARPRRPLRLVLAACLGQFGFNGRHAGGDLVKYEGDLLIAGLVAAQTFRARAIKRALQHLHDRRQLHDPRVSRLVDCAKIGVRRSQCCNLGLDRLPLGRQGEDQRMGIGKGRRKLCNGRRHRRPSQQSRRQSSKPFSAPIQFAAGYQPIDCGRFTTTGRTFVQSSPSISASNCAWFSRTRVGAIFGQQNLASSRVLANRQTPLPSHQTALIRSALFERNTYSAPLNGSAPPSRTSAIKPVAPFRKSTGVLAT